MPTRPTGGDSEWYRLAGTEPADVDADDCDHEEMELLGADPGNNEYYRCQTCGDVLLNTGEYDHRATRREIEAELDEPTGSGATRIMNDLIPSDAQRRPPGSTNGGLGDRLAEIRRRLFDR